MRRAAATTALALLAGAHPLLGQESAASFDSPPQSRAWLSLGDALAVAGGGASAGGSNALSQLFRLSATVNVWNDHGLDFTVFRAQTLLPTSGRFGDPDFDNPAGDGLILSYASIAPGRRSADLPAVFTLGAGIARRQTSKADSTHDTWVARLAYDSYPSWRFTRRMDLSVGASVLIMPARNGKSYVAGLGASFRLR